MELTGSQFADLGVALAFLAVGFILALITARTLEFENNTVLAALIVVPVIIFLLVSGRLTDFSAFGVEAKFRSEATRSIGEIALAKDLAVSDAQADKGDFTRDAVWGECRPYLLLNPKTVPAGNSPRLGVAAVHIASVLRTSILCNRLLAVVVLDERNKVIGYFEPELFLETLRIPLAQGNTDPELLSAQVMESELGIVLKNPIERAESDEGNDLFLPAKTDAVSALSRMQEAQVDVAVFTNAAGEFRGVIPRQAVIETILLAVTKALTPP